MDNNNKIKKYVLGGDNTKIIKQTQQEIPQAIAEEKLEWTNGKEVTDEESEFSLAIKSKKSEKIEKSDLMDGLSSCSENDSGASGSPIQEQIPKIT